MGSICHGYICIVLYMKLIWFSRDLCLIGGWGQSAIGISALWYIYMKFMWCNGFPEIYAQLEEGWGQSAMVIYALCYI